LFSFRTKKEETAKWPGPRYLEIYVMVDDSFLKRHLSKKHATIYIKSLIKAVTKIVPNSDMTLKRRYLGVFTTSKQ